MKRHQSWVSAKGQSSAQPAPGDQDLEPDQELQDALLKLKKTKLDLAGVEQDITNWGSERDRWKARAEAAEKKLQQLDSKERRRDRSTGRSDDETSPRRRNPSTGRSDDEDTPSFSASFFYVEPEASL